LSIVFNGIFDLIRVKMFPAETEVLVGYDATRSNVQRQTDSFYYVRLCVYTGGLLNW
jgi:hypothetical protein